MNELISVILPVWKSNMEQLKQCIDSILTQTYPQIELIIVYKKFPASDEQFYQLVNTYNDKRITIIDDPNKGIAAARNAGIRESSGELVAQIDSDDFCENTKFEKQLKFMNDYKCDIVGTWAHYVTSSGTKIMDLQRPTTHNDLRRKIVLRTPIFHSSVLMKKKVLENVGFYDESFVYAEDYELWMRAMSQGYKFGNVPEYLITLRAETTSLTRGPTWKKFMKYVRKAKKKAVFDYGFSKPRDFFYYLAMPLDYFVSPTLGMRIKKIRKNISDNNKQKTPN